MSGVGARKEAVLGFDDTDAIDFNEKFESALGVLAAAESQQEEITEQICASQEDDTSDALRQLQNNFLDIDMRIAVLTQAVKAYPKRYTETVQDRLAQSSNNRQSRMDRVTAKLGHPPQASGWVLAMQSMMLDAK